MPRSAALRPRKRPMQARSRATVDALIDAAARILVDGGYGEFSTNRVAACAGVSVGSLYQYFPNKESLLAELRSRHVAQIEHGLGIAMASMRDAPLPEVVAALIEATVAAHLIAPELHRMLSAEAPNLHPTDASSAFARRAAASVRALMESRRRELAITDLDLATFLVVRTVEATIHEAVVERPADLASGAVAREVTRLLVGYLTGKTAISRSHPPPDRRSRSRRRDRATLTPPSAPRAP